MSAHPASWDAFTSQALLNWHREAAEREAEQRAAGPDDDSESLDSPWR